MKKTDPKYRHQIIRSCRMLLQAPYVLVMLFFLTALLSACVLPPANQPVYSAGDEPSDIFKQRIDTLRQKHHIPGLSLAVVHQQKVLFSHGFGYADLRVKIPATPDTPYNIASLTKPFAAALLLKLSEQGRLDLDLELSVILENRTFSRGDRTFHGYADACSQIKKAAQDTTSPYLFLIRDFRCDTEPITVRHLLTHTSQGQPGQNYFYNGFLFGFLSSIIETASGRSYEDMLKDHIIQPLNMNRTLPTWDDKLRHNILSDRARYYRKAGFGFSPSSYPVRLSASAGMVSTVLDLAKFDAAMDRNLIVSPESKNSMFSPGFVTDGRPLPYGLGWFVQNHQGGKLVWHYGHAPNAYSSLILKCPEKKFTLILLANSDGLSGPFKLGAGDITKSPFATAFLDYMALMDKKGDGS